MEKELRWRLEKLLKKIDWKKFLLSDKMTLVILRRSRRISWDSSLVLRMTILFMALSAKINKTEFHVGDEIEVHYKILEKKKERTQIFSGVVIAIRGREENKSFTVRKIASLGIGVERIFPLSSPWIKKIAVKKKGRVRRAKLFYLRQRTGKQATRIKERK